MERKRIAVVGSGISGLSAGWLLSKQYAVTLFEASDTLGGHTNTVDVTLEGRTFPVDTGFLVFNDRTYHNLCALFDHLGVGSVESEMSFSVRVDEDRLEWAGGSLATVFAQKRNLINPEFWGMLKDILHFNRESTALVEQGAGKSICAARGSFIASRSHEPGHAFTAGVYRDDQRGDGVRVRGLRHDDERFPGARLPSSSPATAIGTNRTS